MSFSNYVFADPSDGSRDTSSEAGGIDNIDSSENTQQMMGDNVSGTVSVGSGAVPLKPIVSFVGLLDNVDETDENEIEAEEKERKQDKKTARHSASQFLSILYSLICVLVGIVFPISEALLESWRSSKVVTIFVVYMLAGSVVVLVYLIIVNKKRPKPTENENVISQENAAFATEDKVTFGLGDSDDKLNEIGHRKEIYMPGSGRLHTTSFSLSNSSSYKDLHKDLHKVHSTNDLLTNSHQTRQKSYVNGGGNTNSNNGSAIQMHQIQNGANLHLSPMNGNVRHRKHTISVTSSPNENQSTTDYDVDAAHFIALNTQTASLAHEGTSFYLRFGCLLFSVAYIMYIVLEMEFYITTHDTPCKLYTDRNIYVLSLQLAFVLVQTFLLFKTESLYITQHKGWVRFGLMHVKATNLVVWIRALVFEIVEGVHHANSSGSDHHVIAQRVPSLLAAITEDYNGTNCTDNDVPITIAYSAYLFPFILEYSLIASATMIAWFAALEIRISGEVLKSIKKYLRKAKRELEKKTKDVTIPAHKILDKAHTGLFCGILVFTGTIVAFILFMYNNQSDDVTRQSEAAQIFCSTDIALCVMAFVAIQIGAIKMRHFGISFLRENSIDNKLLLISFSGLTLYELFQVICLFYTIENGDTSTEIILSGTASVLTLIESLSQTIFITYGMQMYACTEEQKREKPGRGVITFLIIINIAFWVIKSFGETSVSADIMEDFYGVTPWQIIQHFNLPFLLFFRFHSSVCLADMWMSAYHGEENPIQYVSLE